MTLAERQHGTATVGKIRASVCRRHLRRGATLRRVSNRAPRSSLGRLTFTPHTGSQGRYYEGTGRGRLDPTLSTVLPRPDNCGIQPTALRHLRVQGTGRIIIY
jgi:hypothetical protein